jgi:haloalkane dehalogenase
LIGLRLVAAHPDRFARVCIANTALPVPPPVLAAERIEAVRRFRAGPTPTMPEVMAAIARANETNFELAFAHWQKWCRDTEDLPVSLAIAGVVDGRTLTPEEIAAYDAPYPDPSYKMGPRAMPTHVPMLPDDPAREPNLAAWKTLEAWEKPFVCAFTDNDPVTAGREATFLERVPKARNRPIAGGGHFPQEGRAEEYASRILETIRQTPRG